MKTLKLTILLGTVLLLAIGCSEKSPEQKLTGKWVVDQEWFAALPESGEEAEKLYGVQAGMWEMTKAFAPIVFYDFEDGGSFISGLDTAATVEWGSWSLSEGSIHLSDKLWEGIFTDDGVKRDTNVDPDEKETIPYNFTDDGKLQLEFDPDTPNFMLTLVKAD